METIFIYELAANSGSSWMFQAPNLHFSNAVVKMVVLEVYNIVTHTVPEPWMSLVNCLVRKEQ